MPGGRPPRHPLGADERNPRDRGGLEGEGPQIFRLEVVDVRLAARAGQHLDFRGHGLQKAGDALGGLVDGQPLHQLGIVGGVMPTGQRPVWQW